MNFQKGLLTLVLLAVSACGVGVAELNGGSPVPVGAEVVPAPAPPAQTQPAKRGPPYPIVLAHGFFGFEEFAGVDFVTYFYGVKDYLNARGEYDVYTPAVDPFNDSTVRGKQLEARIEAILKVTGHAKVNIIGHSQGGMDARVVAHNRPDLVATVLTVATPHHGSEVGDLVTGVIKEPLARDAVDGLVRLIGAPLWTEVGPNTALFKPLMLFSKPGVQAFNAQYPDAPGVKYFSVTGRSGLRAAKDECDAPNRPDFIRQWDNTLDTTNPGLVPTELYLERDLFSPYANDGLVRVKDAKWGRFLGCVPADHLDEIGQLFGSPAGVGNLFNHKKFYADLVEFLRAQGT